MSEIKMTKKLSVVLVSSFLFVLLIALLAATTPTANPQEAARLNNIGVAYMNQQLFEKALKAFEEAAAADPALQVTTVNRGVALLNLQRHSAIDGTHRQRRVIRSRFFERLQRLFKELLVHVGDADVVEARGFLRVGGGSGRG